MKSIYFNINNIHSMEICSSREAPYDIDEKKIAGTCQSRCSFYSKYHSSSCMAHYAGDHIHIKYYEATQSPVNFD